MNTIVLVILTALSGIVLAHMLLAVCGAVVKIGHARVGQDRQWHTPRDPRMVNLNELEPDDPPAPPPAKSCSRCGCPYHCRPTGTL